MRQSVTRPALPRPAWQVIRETARFVRRGGGQVEVLLRVKQADRPTFGFLMPGHPLHDYFSWLKQNDPPVRAWGLVPLATGVHR